VKKTPIAALAILLAAASPAPAQAPAPPATAAKPKPAVKPSAAKPSPIKHLAAGPDGDKTHPAAKPVPNADAKAPEPNAPRDILPTPPKEISKEEAVKRANAFFNASPVMTADFVQIGADGKRSEGKLHVQRAGRVRFEYAQPATMEVVSDGAQVLVRDRKLNTQDLYFINQTPLKFLMKEKIDLEHDVTLDSVSNDDAGVTIAVTDKSTFGGTSHLKLIFDPKTFKLKQWQITDPQGYETLISLFNIDQTKIPDPALFKINK